MPLSAGDKLGPYEILAPLGAGGMADVDRNVKTRLRDIGEARITIENVGKEPDAAIAVGPRSRFGTLPWIAAGVMTPIAAVSLWAPWRSTESVDGRMLRLDVDLGSDVQLPAAPTNSGSSVAISPDGTRLAFASGTPRKLFVRRLDQPNASELPSTTGARGPFFSPDGQWVGFAAGGKLIKTSVEGGSPIPLGDVNNFLGASRGEDGSIIVGGGLGKGMLRISPGGGAPETADRSPPRLVALRRIY
jgi:hypothetical protein